MAQKTQRPTVRKRTQRVKSANGVKTYSYWSAELGTVDGKRIRKSFKTKREAEAAATKTTVQRHKIGDDALRLSTADMRDAAEALRLLATVRPKPALTDIARYWMRHTRPGDGVNTRRELFAAWLTEKRENNLRECTITGAELKGNQFVKVHEETPAHDITKDDIGAWLEAKAFTPATRKSYLVMLRDLFGFAVRKGYRVDNPAKAFKPPRLDKIPVRVLTPAQTQALLAAAEKACPRLIPYLALSLFAGLRPDEVKRLTWSDIHFDTRHIAVTAGSAKCRVSRDVDMTDNLLAILAAYRATTGDVYWQRKAFERVRAAAGLSGRDVWQRDILRHSFATYHNATHRNLAETAMQMGDLQNTVRTNYLTKVTRESAAAYWRVTLTRADNRIDFANAAS